MGVAASATALVAEEDGVVENAPSGIDVQVVQEVPEGAGEAFAGFVLLRKGRRRYAKFKTAAGSEAGSAVFVGDQF